MDNNNEAEDNFREALSFCSIFVVTVFIGDDENCKCGVGPFMFLVVSCF